MGTWVVGTSNQLFVKGVAKFKLKPNFQKNEIVTGKTPLFMMGTFLVTFVFVLTWLLIWQFCIERMRFRY